MRIFYKLYTTGEHDEAEPLAIGLASEAGITAYAELNDYDMEKVSAEADQDIIRDMLGKAGMKSLVESRKRSKGLIAPTWRVSKFVNGFLKAHDQIELIGYASYWEMQELLKFLDLENFSKRLTIVNLEPGLIEKYESLQRSVSTELPGNNALRWALIFKHIAKKYERDKNLAHK